MLPMFCFYGILPFYVTSFRDIHSFFRIKMNDIKSIKRFIITFEHMWSFESSYFRILNYFITLFIEVLLCFNITYYY